MKRIMWGRMSGKLKKNGFLKHYRESHEEREIFSEDKDSKCKVLYIIKILFKL